jgi:dTDP-4-amino-4,6-dideoxygalactose transaminase
MTTLRDKANWPLYAEDERQAVMDVMTSGRVNYWTGSEGRSFENEFAQVTNCNYGICVANGTLALELGLRSLGITSGDEVIVTPYTFIASASAIVMQSGTPVFADIDQSSLNITAETIARKITDKTRAIVVVHLLGLPCDMDPIMALAQKHGLYVIEDCAQAHGAKYKGKPVGSFGDVAAFSFCQDKIMSTGGEGGMLVTNNKDVWEKAWSFKDHGKSHAAMLEQSHPPGFRWVHESIGTNWRMTEMQAAIGRVQLKKLDHWVEQRRENARVFSESLSSSLIKSIPVYPDNFYHAYYKYTLQIDLSKLASDWSRDRIIEEITGSGFPCFSGICPEIYREKAFDAYDIEPLPIARAVGQSTLQFLVDPTFSAEDMKSLAEEVNRVFARALV